MRSRYTRPVRQANNQRRLLESDWIKHWFMRIHGRGSPWVNIPFDNVSFSQWGSFNYSRWRMLFFSSAVFDHRNAGCLLGFLRSVLTQPGTWLWFSKTSLEMVGDKLWVLFLQVLKKSAIFRLMICAIAKGAFVSFIWWLGRFRLWCQRLRFRSNLDQGCWKIDWIM